jgi:hypothetical protein
VSETLEKESDISDILNDADDDDDVEFPMKKTEPPKGYVRPPRDDVDKKPLMFTGKEGVDRLLINKLTMPYHESDYTKLRTYIKRKINIVFKTGSGSKEDNAAKVLRFLNSRGMDYKADTTIHEMIDFVDNLKSEK